MPSCTYTVQQLGTSVIVNGFTPGVAYKAKVASRRTQRGRRMRGDVSRRVTYFLRSRKGWYLEEKAWRRKAGQLRVEAESLFEDARCDTAAFSAGEAQRVEEGPSVIVNGLRRWIKFSGSGDALRRMRRSLGKNESA